MSFGWQKFVHKFFNSGVDMSGNRSKLLIKSVLCGAAILAVRPMWVSADVSLNVADAATGGTVIQAAANQQINLLAAASGTDATAGIKGLDIYLQIDNGGTDNGAASNPAAPSITTIDLTTGIFSGGSGNNGYQVTPDNLIAVDGTSTGSTSTVQVPAGSLLGTITLNATGLAAGTTFTLNFENTSGTYAGTYSDYTDANNQVQNFANSPDDIFTFTVGPIATQWNVSGGGSWTTPTNWSAGLPDGPGDTAIFATGVAGQITSPSIVTLDGNHSVGHIVFNNSNAYTINAGSPAGQITIDNSGAGSTGVADIQVLLGNHAVNAPVAIPAGVTVTTATSSSLVLGGAVTGASGLTAGGSGTLTLGASNSYSGGTSITGGTLVATNASALSTGGVAITGTATLDIGGGSALSLNLGNGAYTQASTATLKLQINDSSSGNYSVLQTTGTASLNGILNLNVGSAGGPVADGTKFQVLNAGSRSGVFSGYSTNIGAGKAFDTSSLEKTGQVSVVNYFNGFENVNGAWTNNSSTYAASVTSYVIGANPVTPGSATQVVNAAAASSNAAYGKLAPTAYAISQGANFPATANVGPLTRFNGNSASFGTGFTTQTDIYLDPSWSGDTNGTGFDYSSAVSDDTGAFHRDFILHTYKADGTLYVSADSNSDYKADPNYLNVDANHLAITAAGWYTVQDTFRNNGGTLAVDVKLFAAGGTSPLFVQTMSAPSDAIAGIGGNNYAWFVNIDTGTGANDFLNVDNTKLLNNTGSGLAGPAVLTSGTSLIGNAVVTGTLASFDIGGTNAGAVTNGYDYLNVTDGTASLSGPLEVDLVEGFQNQITPLDQFTVFQADAVSGNFDDVTNGGRVFTSDGTGSFLTTYQTSPTGEVSLVLSDFQAVPEPSSMALLALGGAALLRRRRK
jgi:fibronectin-binding autotransporter adhesin